MWKQELVSILKKDLGEIKKKNPRYSLRAYSKKMGLGFGSLSDVLNKKRNLSPQLGKKILSRLVLEKEDAERLTTLIERDQAKTVSMMPDEARLVVENWYYFAILNILELKPAPRTVSEIATRLGLPQKKVVLGIAALKAWGFIKDINGVYIVATNSWKTTDGIPSESIRKSHVDGLSLATQAIQKLPMEKRDMTSLVFNGNSKQLEKVRMEIRKFLHKVNKLMSVGEADSVYKINTQLFPLDKWDSNKE